MSVFMSKNALPSIDRYELSLQSTANWLLKSINKGKGGSCAHFSPLLGWSKPYPETTGYIIPTLLKLYNYYHDERFLVAASSTGEWLLSIQNKDGSWPGGLYPNKNLPGFLEKNNIPDKDVLGSKFLTSLVEEGNKQIIVKDCHGGYHFNGLFNNINSLVDEIKKLPEKYTDLVKKERDYVYDLFEKVFDHKSFTGRSGTFYGYEGLGSIYWHMVSKLQLAVYEVTSKAIKSKDDKKTIGKLFDHYFEINEGVGVNKSPDLYGAFPTDPYSHTPFGRGAQQPGMTGQVKEDIISRFGELGLRVFDGKIRFDPSILRKDEFNLTEIEYQEGQSLSFFQILQLQNGTMSFGNGTHFGKARTFGTGMNFTGAQTFVGANTFGADAKFGDGQTFSAAQTFAKTINSSMTL